MRINEVDTPPDGGADPNKLMGLINFLAGRAENSNSTKQISQQAFIQLAKSIGINITDQNIGQILNSPPSDALLEPIDQESGMISFRGADIGPSNMSVPQAQQVVSKSAKSAMRRMK